MLSSSEQGARPVKCTLGTGMSCPFALNTSQPASQPQGAGRCPSHLHSLCQTASQPQQQPLQLSSIPRERT